MDEKVMKLTANSFTVQIFALKHNIFSYSPNKYLQYSLEELYCCI